MLFCKCICPQVRVEYHCYYYCGIGIPSYTRLPIPKYKLNTYTRVVYTSV